MDQNIILLYGAPEKQKVVMAIVSFLIDVAVNNTFQLYRLRKLDAENHAWMVSNLDKQL